MAISSSPARGARASPWAMPKPTKPQGSGNETSAFSPLFFFEIYLLAADKGQIQLELCSQGPVKPSEAPLCRITFLTGMSLKSPRRWSLTAPDSTKDTPDRCLHGILQHFKRELVVLIMVVVWKETMQARQETFDQTLLLAQCRGTVTIPSKGPFLAEWLTSDLWMQTSSSPSLFISEHFYTGPI